MPGQLGNEETLVHNLQFLAFMEREAERNINGTFDTLRFRDLLRSIYITGNPQIAEQHIELLRQKEQTVHIAHLIRNLSLIKYGYHPGAYSSNLKEYCAIDFSMYLTSYFDSYEKGLILEEDFIQDIEAIKSISSAKEYMNPDCILGKALHQHRFKVATTLIERELTDLSCARINEESDGTKRQFTAQELVTAKLSEPWITDDYRSNCSALLDLLESKTTGSENPVKAKVHPINGKG